MGRLRVGIVLAEGTLYLQPSALSNVALSLVDEIAQVLVHLRCERSIYNLSREYSLWKKQVGVCILGRAANISLLHH